MVNLIWLALAATNALVVGGEQFIRCNSGPMTICGSDMTLYKSECEFLASKANNTDLTIVDLADCIGSDPAISGVNASELGTVETGLGSESRSLRGSSLFKWNSELLYGNMSSYLRGESNGSFVGLSDVMNGSEADSALTYGYNWNESTFYSSLMNDTNGNGSNAYSSFYLGEYNPVFKSINKYNVNVINAVVENFDVSSFILSNGKYNLSKLSLSVLEMVLKILKTKKYKMQSLVNKMRYYEHMWGGNSTVPNSGLKSLNNPYNFTLMGTNSSQYDYSTYNGLNVTFKLINLNSTNNYLSSPLILGLALNTLNNMNIGSLRLDANESSLENTVNYFTEGGNRSEGVNRSLLSAEHVQANGSVPSNGTTDQPGEVYDCDMSIASSESPTASSFHCIFKNSTANIKVASEYVVRLTELVLKDFLDKSGLNSTLEEGQIQWSPFMFNPMIERANQRGLKNRFLSGSRLRDDNHVSLVLDFFDLLLVPLNYTSNDLGDSGVDEIFVNFDLNMLKDDQTAPPKTRANETVVMEELNEIFQLESMIKNFSIGQRYNEASNYTLTNSLRVASEALPVLNSSSSIDDFFREFPPAFDRVRGQDCVIECDDHVDYHCANNGVTYRNLCEFRNAQCADISLIFVSYGECLPLIIKG
ncbi:signal peptide-containing protein [Cryptosporidium canis]|uniref:Signal peptide-containing protein n=1 Tax=Cryptosporidium canis TaxID=195482 RepID=A0A9D5HXZ8_9CRYT|nr:signal peptide-containing protein [Cryptosporidium canis]